MQLSQCSVWKQPPAYFAKKPGPLNTLETEESSHDAAVFFANLHPTNTTSCLRIHYDTYKNTKLHNTQNGPCLPRPAWPDGEAVPASASSMGEGGVSWGTEYTKPHRVKLYIYCNSSYNSLFTFFLNSFDVTSWSM